MRRVPFLVLTHIDRSVYFFICSKGVAALQTDKSKDYPEQTLSSLSPTTNFVTKLPQGRPGDGYVVSVLAYVSDRLSGTARAADTVVVATLAASFRRFRRARRRLLEDEGGGDGDGGEFGNYLLNLSTSLLAESSSVGDSEKSVGTVANVGSAKEACNVSSMEPTFDRQAFWTVKV